MNRLSRGGLARFGAIAAALVLSALTVSPSGGAETLEVPVEGRGAVGESPPALIEDARVVAEAQHVSPDEALNYLASSAQWDVVVEKIRQVSRSTFQSAYRNGLDDPSGHLVLTSAPSPAVISLLATLPFDTSVSRGVGSEAELTKASETVAAAILGSGVTVPVESVVDARSGAITVSLLHGTTAAQLQGARGIAARTVTSVLGDMEIPVNVVVGTSTGAPLLTR